MPPTSGFELSVSYRWQYSDRHFTGDEEDTERAAEDSEVINDSNFIDLTVAYAVTDRFSLALTIPWSAHERSQPVRDQNREVIGRFQTQSAGLGDLRLVGRYWLWDPHKHPKGNILLGLGVDIPTGESDHKDTFQVFNAQTGRIEAQERTVDQSIQPGDGGWGIILDLFAYQQIAERWNLYAGGAYTITPEETNGVPTFRSNPFEAEMSIADTYGARAGVEYTLWPKYHLTVGLGGRIEGVPVHDLVGGSDGFRRPGYAVSVEPSIGFMVQDWAFTGSVPIAVYRNRLKSVPDEQWEESTGVERHGDAAFADYIIQFSVTHRF